MLLLAKLLLLLVQGIEVLHLVRAGLVLLQGFIQVLEGRRGQLMPLGWYGDITVAST